MWTQRKFLSLKPKAQHRLAAEELRRAYLGAPLTTYRLLEEWLHLAPVQEATKHHADRYHFHLALADLTHKEHNLLPPIHTGDAPSSEPFLPIAIYLDNLRSAHNVGAILRTTEAFRLGTVYFSPATPSLTNPKVQKTSKGTHTIVPTYSNATLDALPRPLIALETAPSSPSLFAFDFPPSFSLLLGNEEYGLSDASLAAADACVHIPLPGAKNSLNVAAAFAIAAATIRQKRVTVLK